MSNDKIAHEIVNHLYIVQQISGDEILFQSNFSASIFSILDISKYGDLQSSRRNYVMFQSDHS